MPQSSSTPPVFFVDCALGSEEVPNGLRAAGATVEIYADHFHGPEQSDAPWIAEVATKEWAILTKDKRLRWNELEKKTIVEAGAAAFILTAGDLPGAEMSAAFVKALPRMTKLLEKYTRPLLCSVSKDGAIRVLIGERRGGVKK